jgi:2-keto-4-pentenoate hydratase/2-oxohepta-3-ene-1,7-dioic acid hydratase in catechol pathway
MRLVNAAGRLGLVIDDAVIDVAQASEGAISANPQAVYENWEDFRSWARTAGPVDGAPKLSDVTLGPPVPAPRQVFAIGLNYRDHAVEGGLDLPETPMVFTKFPSSIAGPYDEITLQPGAVDYEAELVVVIGRHARQVSADRAWDYVAGLTVGQDLSDRVLQMKPPVPQQFSLGKSLPGFGPIGPAVVTADDVADPSDLEIGCLLNGEQVQKARTSDMIFDIPTLIAYLSGILALLPGDLIFTGTPSGVGFVRNPQKLIHGGDELVTYIEELGSMRHQFVDG